MLSALFVILVLSGVGGLMLYAVKGRQDSQVTLSGSSVVSELSASRNTDAQPGLIPNITKSAGPFIEIGSAKFHLYPMIKEGLPRLKTEFNWQLQTYIDDYGKDNVKLSLLNANGKAIDWKSVSYSDRGIHGSWAALGGCTRGYMKEQVEEEVIRPLVGKGQRMARDRDAIDKVAPSNSEVF